MPNNDANRGEAAGEPPLPTGSLTGSLFGARGTASTGDGALGKPSDHPDFYRLPPPPGRSRESAIRLDPLGRFFHDGTLLDHAKLANAFHGWIRRHPDDGRYILDNGYDWTYFQVDDVPFFVRGASDRGLSLVGGLTVPWEDLRALAQRGDDLYGELQLEGRGTFPARFLQDGRLAIGARIEARDGHLGVAHGDRFLPISGSFSS